MRLTGSLGLLALSLVTGQPALGQQFPECTQELVRTDDCADVINPAACYNMFRWSPMTLSCIDGTDDADRRRKASTYLT